MPVNIGNPDEITIGDFANEVIDMVGNPEAKVVYKPLPKDDPKVRQPNIELAKKILNWEPKINRAEGMARTYEYFKKVVPVETLQ